MKTDKYSTFRLAFIGQDVIITTKLKQTAAIDAEVPVIETVPIYHSGILVDFDAEFLYLGKNHFEINQCLKWEDFHHIAIIDEANELQQILQDMPGPQNEEDFN